MFMSLESRHFFNPAMLCVISEMTFVISSSCLFKTAKYLESIASRSDLSFRITVFISLCKSSPCLLIAAVNFCEFLASSVFFNLDVVCNLLIFRVNFVLKFL